MTKNIPKLYPITWLLKFDIDELVASLKALYSSLMVFIALYSSFMVFISSFLTAIIALAIPEL